MNLTDENLKKIKFEILSNFSGDCWIAGGAITDFILGRKIKDIDVFFPSEKDALKAKNKLVSIGGRMTYEYPQGFNVKYKGGNYDLAYIGSTPQNKKFTHHKDYFNHLESMELHYIGNHPNKFYLNKAKRILRYFDKGFSLDQDNLEKWLNTLIKDHKKPKRKF